MFIYLFSFVLHIIEVEVHPWVVEAVAITPTPWKDPFYQDPLGVGDLEGSVGPQDGVDPSVGVVPPGVVARYEVVLLEAVRTHPGAEDPHGEGLQKEG